MIDPTNEDIGREVTWRQYVGGPSRKGVITAFSPAFVYVRYEHTAFSEPTAREELDFARDR